MNLTDVNVLVSEYWDDHPEHRRCRHFLQIMPLAEESFGVSDLVLSGYLRIVTHPRIFSRLSPPEQAVRFADRLRRHPRAVRNSPVRRHWQIFLVLCKEAVARGNLVPDALFAAMAIESGCEWVTLARDESASHSTRSKNVGSKYTFRSPTSAWEIRSCLQNPPELQSRQQRRIEVQRYTRRRPEAIRPDDIGRCMLAGSIRRA